ncbi:MAG TPA: tRNA-dihydrouridine synthase family protein, partial [Candidatus Saccharibacteria bacterium]|nr:tRNA-dihydrouridine synthase family protein [Candidatus Saccharibacteria bacterium]
MANNIWNDLKKPIFVLAPMDDVTDTVFRQVIADCAPPDLYFTEFVNVDGLQSVGREKLMHKLRYTAKEKPIIAQVWGKNSDNYYKTTKDLIKMGFDGVDINMGCPVKAVVKDGCCVALVDNRILASEIIKATQKAAEGKIPVSVKTRIGNKTTDMSWIEFLLTHNLDALTVHGRTGKQMSKVPADWHKIGEARELRDRLSPATKIIGNGDVMSRADGLKLADKYKLDGIMIGRGIFHDPFVFANSLSSESPWGNYSKAQKIELYKK